MKKTQLKQKTPLKAKRGLEAKANLRQSPKPIKAPPSKGKLPTVSKLKKEADKWWSLAIRLRFADSKGNAQCITCGAEKPARTLQCGHFMSRSYNSTRYSDTNTAPQCYGCNVMHQGRQYEFGIALDELYGAGTAKEMHDLAKQGHQFNRAELQQIIEEAKAEVAFYERV